MSFTFGTPSSNAGSGQAATTTSGPAAGSLFGSTAGGAPSTGFSFGNSTAGGTNTNQSAGGGLFGGNTAGKNDSKPGLFGNTGTSTPSSSTPSLFGAQTTSNSDGGGGLFGSATEPAQGGGGLFGNSTATAKPTLQFGQPAATPAASTATTTPAAPSGGIFGSVTTTTNTPQTNTSKATPGGLFGNAGMTGNSLFGSATPANNTLTPAKQSFAGLGTSTTPAGAPPADKPAGSLFGVKPAAAGSSSGGLFGQASNTSVAPSSIATTTASGPGGLFGSATPAAAPVQPVASSAGTSAQATTTSGLFSSTPAKPLFSSNTPSSGAAPATSTPSLFSATPASTAPVTTTTTTAATPSLFVKPATTSAASAATSVPASSGLFGAASIPTSTSAATITAPATTAATTAAGTTSGLFASCKPAEAAAITSAGQDGKSNTAANLAASTMGPTSQLPRLKNKTMDEIITRWATDLSKYQKEFKAQADKVSEWDRVLVENGEKIQKLYSSTYEAERANNEIERQLSSVESQQDELTSWLDQYEQELEGLFSKQIGSSEQVGGPDQERERTYKTAEKLTDRLDEMGKDLTKMIKEINDMSSTLSKGNKPDDPLSQIVRVLNGHLSQLQWIDTNAAALQAKVAAAQKASGNMGGAVGGPETEAAESFYRSYRGGFK